jgi:transposase
MRRFLEAEHYSGRRAPAVLLAQLRRAPAGRAGELEMTARRMVVLALVASLCRLSDEIRRLTLEISHSVRSHPDGHIFLSLFKNRDSVVCAATLLAEIGDCRERYPTAEHLAADAGMSPVAIESGKRKVACFRRGCDHRLRDATCVLADATRRWHPWAQDRYAAARNRGHNHTRAIRTLGRAWCRVIWRCWQDRVAYDPDRHRGLQQHITVTIPASSGPRPDLPATQRMAGAIVTAGGPQGRARSA